MFPSGKIRSWVEALFEVINVTEAKHFEWSIPWLTIMYYFSVFLYIYASLTMDKFGMEEETEYCKY